MPANSQWRQNRVVWFEIPAADMRRATGFYEAILATSLRQQSFGPHAMAVFPHPESAASGCIIQGQGYRPGIDGPVTYINADPSLDAVLARVVSAGGAIAQPRTELPEGLGCFAHIIDTEGNRVGLHAMG